jgi:hypothetical protein
MEDKIRELYNILNESKDFKGVYTSPDELSATLSDDAKVVEFYDILNSSDEFKGVFTSVDEFKSTFSIKKKVSFADSLAEGKGFLEALGVKSGEPLIEPSTLLPQPKTPKAKPVTKEETYPDTYTPIDYLKSAQKKRDFIEQDMALMAEEYSKQVAAERDKIEAEYAERAKTTPRFHLPVLEKEKNERINTVIDGISRDLEKDVRQKYFQDDYDILDPKDVKTIQGEAEGIAQSGRPFDQQKADIDALKSMMLEKIPEGERAAAEKELNHIIAKKLNFDSDGNLSLFGWKTEAQRQEQELDKLLIEAQQSLTNKYPTGQLLVNPTTGMAEFVVKGLSSSEQIKAQKEYDEVAKAYNAAKIAKRALKEIQDVPMGKGNFLEGISTSLDRSLATAGWSDVVDAINKNRISKKVADGTATPIERVEYNLLSIQDIAENSKNLGTWYKRGVSIGQSLPFMASFALSSAPAAVGEATAMRIAGKGIQSAFKKNVIKGIGGALARTPILPIGYEDAISRMTGAPTLNEDLTWSVDESAVEPTWKAVLKGGWVNWTEALSEAAGGFGQGTGAFKGVGKALGLAKIPKGTLRALNTIGMQPGTEFGEESLVNLIQIPITEGKEGWKEAWTKENVWETFVVTGLISGFFGGMAAPSVIGENIRRGKHYESVDIFGKDIISSLRIAIENKDQAAFSGAYGRALDLVGEGKAQPSDLQGLAKYAHTLAVEKGATVAQETIPEVIAEQTGAPIEGLRAQPDKAGGEVRVGAETKPLTEEAPSNLARTQEIEQLAKNEGYEFEVEADSDSNMTALNVLDSEKRKIEPEDLPEGIRALAAEYTQLMHQDEVAIEPQNDVVEPLSPTSDTKVSPKGESASETTLDKGKEGITPIKLPFIEINQENVAEIENNVLSSLQEKGATEAEITEAKGNLDIIKKSVDEKARRQNDDLGEDGEGVRGEISEITPSEIEGVEGALAGVFRGRRDGNRTPRISEEEQSSKQLAPNGEKSNLSPENHAFVRTPEFKSKFGDWQKGEGSVVLDRNGEPLLVYTGKGKYHPEGIDPTKASEGKLFTTGNKSEAIDFARFRGKQPVVYSGFVVINDEQLSDGSGKINPYHDNQQEFITTTKGQFIPVRAEEVPKLKKKTRAEGQKVKSPQGKKVKSKDTQAVEAPIISETTQTTTEGENVPPTKATQATEGKDGGKKREKSYLTRLYNSLKASDRLKKDIEEGGLIYSVLSNVQSSQDADAIIAEMGFEKAEQYIRDRNNAIAGSTRNIIANRLGFHYDELASQAEAEGDFDAALDYAERAYSIFNFVDYVGRDGGRFNQIGASAEISGLLTPKRAVVRQKRQIREQRDGELKKAKKEIERLRKELQDINKKAIDEVLGSKEYERGRTGTARKPRVSPQLKERVKREQEYRKSQWESLKQTGTLSSSIAGFSKEQIEVLGNIVASYVREGIYRTAALAKKLQDDYFKNTGQRLSDEDAVSLIPKEVDGRDMEDIAREGETADATEKLVSRIDRMLKGSKPQKFDPIRQMIDTLFGKVKEKDTKEKPKAEKKSNVDKIREALENKAEYAEVWEAAKKEVEFNIEANPELSDAQRQEYKARLDGFYNEMIGKPYSEAQVRSAMAETVGNIYNYLINKIEKQGFDVRDVRDDIVEQIINRTGATESEAQGLADSIINNFNERTEAIRLKNAEREAAAEERKQQIAENMAKKREKRQRKPVWGARRKQAAERLVKKLDKSIAAEEKNNPSLLAFTNRLNTQFATKAKELTKDKKEQTPPPKKVDVLKEIFDNIDKYRDVVDDARAFVAKEYADKPELLQALDDYLGQIASQPFSESMAEAVTREAIRDMGVEIDKVVRQHYTVQDATARSLVDKLVDDLGLSEADATMLADSIQKAFDKIATQRKRTILLQGLKARAKKAGTPKAGWERLIDLTNLGAFSNAEFAEAYADAMGFPKLTEAQAKEMERLAGEIHKWSGFKKHEKIQDYFAYVAKLPGVDLGEVAIGMWYASILSGQRTQFKNILANTANLISEWFVATLYNGIRLDGSTVVMLSKGLGAGFGRGITEWRHVMATGYSSIRDNKIEMPSYMEQWRFKGGRINPANWAKYVSRFMIATDAFFYCGLKEMRAHELAMVEARKRNKEATQATQSDYALASEILYKTSQRRAEAEAQADAEGLKGNERKKRIYDIMDGGRPTNMVAESSYFASKGTFNYKPEGVLGMLTESISDITNKMTLRPTIPFSGGKTVSLRIGKLFVPFTRIIANVANIALEYTPVGAVRAAKGTIGWEALNKNPDKQGFYRKLTTEERSKTAIRAMMGAMATIAVYALSEPGDDGEDPPIRITANGTGDYSKNQQLKDTEEGFEPYSIKIGKHWYSYQYTPLFLALAPIGLIRDNQRYKRDRGEEDVDAADIVGAMLLSTGSALSDMTWLASVSGLLEAFGSGEIGTFTNYLKRTASSVSKGFVYPKAIEQTKQMIDDYYDNPKRFASSVYGKIVKDMPVISNYYPIQYNALGQPVTVDAVQMMGKGTSDPVASFVGRYWKETGGLSNVRQKALLIYDVETGKDRIATDVEFMNFIRVSGQEISQRLEEELMPYEDEMTPSDIGKAIKSIESDVKQRVKAEMFGWREWQASDPKFWQEMIDNRAVQVGVSSKTFTLDNKKISLSEEQLIEYNNSAMSTYIESLKEYFSDKKEVETNKEEIYDVTTNTSVYDWRIRGLWDMAREGADWIMLEKIQGQQK